MRSIYFWIARCVPGLKGLPGVSLPMRIAMMVFLFLLLVYSAGVANYIWDKDRGRRFPIEWVLLLLLVVIITVIVYYLVKFLMIKEVSRFPAIDRIWEEGIEECRQAGILMSEVPVFFVLGAGDQQQASQLMKASQLPITVTLPTQGKPDIAFFACSTAIYVYLNGCCCLSRLAIAPKEFSTKTASPTAVGNSAGGTIDFSMLSGGGLKSHEPADAQVGQTLTDGLVPGTPVASPDALYAEAVGGTMLLPEGQALEEFLAANHALAADIEHTAVPQLSSEDINHCEQKLSHVCNLLIKERYPLCPLNGLLTLLPFELVDTAAPQIQTAVIKDLAVLRKELLIRCSNTVLITQLERDEGFQELVKRVGEDRARNFRFGKGADVWNAPIAARLDAIAAHAVFAFEDWIYMLFQEDGALKHRYNSRLFMLLCRIRGRFGQNLRTILARGLGFDPQTESQLADEQFLFGGCYFAATGSEASRQAFAKSVFAKGIELEGELEWTPEAQHRDRQLQFVANLLALVGMGSLLAIVAMLLWKFTRDSMLAN